MQTIWVLRPGALGDTILTLPFLNALQNQAKEKRILFWGTSAYGKVIKYFLPDIIIGDFQSRELLPLFSPDFQLADMQLSQPEQIFSFLKIDQVFKSNLISFCPNTIFKEFDEACDVAIDQQMLSILSENLAKENYSFIRPLEKNQKLLVHCGSGTMRKLLPISFWDILLQRLKDDYEITVLLGPAELELSRMFQGKFQIMQNQSLVQLIENMKQFGSYLGLDSGVSHLAGALGLSGFAIFHASNPIVWRPMGRVVALKYKETNIEEISERLKR